jgi:hypothetical protein
MEYATEIVSLDNALWILAEAERRYQGKAILDPDSLCPLILDAADVPHTDEVLRSGGREFGPPVEGAYPVRLTAKPLNR